MISLSECLAAVKIHTNFSRSLQSQEALKKAKKKKKKKGKKAGQQRGGHRRGAGGERGSGGGRGIRTRICNRLQGCVDGRAAGNQ